MRRLLTATSLLLLIGLAAQPVSAASIIPIDPVIGVRGVTGGSEPSTSNEFFEMVQEGCPDISDPTYCLEYDILQNVESITSLTFQFKDADGLIPSNVLFGDFETGNNGFTGFERLDDGFSVRFFFQPIIIELLSTLSSSLQTLQCPTGENGSVSCSQGSTIQVYLFVPPSEGEPNPPYFVSLRAVNDVPVPEPGLLVLLGLGLTFVGRRLRQRWSKSALKATS